MHHGRPAARHADHIAFDGDGMGATELHGLHRLAALDIHDAAAGENGDALGTGARKHIGGDGGTMIRHGDGDAGGGEVQRRGIGRVVVGDDHRALLRRHREAIGVAAKCRSEHHARPVIVGEDERPLDRARCHHDGLGAQLGEQHAGLTLARIGAQMAAILDQHGEVAVIEALHGGAGEGLHIGQALQLIDTSYAPRLMLRIGA